MSHNGQNLSTPNISAKQHFQAQPIFKLNNLAGTRTHNPQVRSLMLCPFALQPQQRELYQRPRTDNGVRSQSAGIR